MWKFRKSLIYKGMSIVHTVRQVALLADEDAGERHDLQLEEPVLNRVGERQHVAQSRDLHVDLVAPLF